MTKPAEIYVRDPDGVTVEHQITKFSQLTIVDNDNAVSTWTIQATLDADSKALAMPGAAIVVDGDGFSVSGPMTNNDRLFDNSNDYITLSGLSDDTYLWERLAYPGLPVPQNDGTGTYKFSNQSHDVRTGAGETIIYQYVMANLGGGDWSSGSLSDRAIDGLILAADQGRGGTVSVSARWDVLGDLCAQIALSAGGLRFGINDLQMWVTEAVDRSNEVELSTYSRTVKSFEYVNTAPTATHVLMAATGTLTDRICVIGGDDAASSRWRRIEKFADGRNAASVAALNQTLDQTIVDGAETSSIKITPTESDTLRYGYDYNLGDIVSFETDCAQGQEKIRQVTINVNDQGRIITPSIQTRTSKAPPSALMVVDQLKLIQERVSALERSV